MSRPVAPYGVEAFPSNASEAPAVVTRQDAVAMSGKAQEASEFLKALAHEMRLLILCQLVDGEKAVGQLEETLGIRQSTVSQQLARLRLEGLVVARREGKQIYYSLQNQDVKSVIAVLVGMFCKNPKASVKAA